MTDGVDSGMANNRAATIWGCPVCGAALQQEGKQWFCASNHRFDQAKEGYTNLLLANQKRSQNPGDTKEMMASRRAFLAADYYRPLADALEDVLSAHLTPGARLLDLGCGEGYYLQQLLQGRDDLCAHGVDISRDAVKLAAKGLKTAQFAVASSFKLPVLPGAVDVALRIFAPADAAEIARVLTPEGVLVVVSPGPRHLFDLKQRIYTEPKEHQLPDAPEGFQLLSARRVHYPLTVVGAEGVGQLLSMTPFLWKGQRDAKRALEAETRFTTEVDFNIRLYGLDNNQQAPACSQTQDT